MTARLRDPDSAVPVPTLHLVIPFLNELPTLDTAVRRVLAAPLPNEWNRRIILVDDGSNSETANLADELATSFDEVMLLRHQKNRGKGAAVRTGFERILEDADDQDIVGIQDADLEYDPNDIGTLLSTLLDSEDDAIYGNRWTKPASSLKERIHRGGNSVLTWFSNSCTGLQLRDIECCYKFIRVPMLKRILPELDEERFGIEPQITASLARNNARVSEAAISYDPRSFQQGKKIGLGDAFEAIKVMRREKRRKPNSPGAGS